MTLSEWLCKELCSGRMAVSMAASVGASITQLLGSGGLLCGPCALRWQTALQSGAQHRVSGDVEMSEPTDADKVHRLPAFIRGFALPSVGQFLVLSSVLLIRHLRN